MEDPDSRELVGSNPDDSRDLRACETESYMALPPGIPAYELEHPGRVVPSPPEVEHGPYSELHLAPSPAAAVIGNVLRLRASTGQPIRQIFSDARRAAIYRVRAPGVRIKDGSRDARLVNGVLGLRLEGEQAQDRLGDRALAVAGAGSSDALADERGVSNAWATVDAAFDDTISALEMPDEGVHPTLKVDWTLVGSVNRLEILAIDLLFKLEFQGQSCVSWRDFLHVRDLNGRRVGPRFFYYLGRQAAYDFVSLTRKERILDWVRFITIVIGFIAACGKALEWLLSQIL